MRKGFLFPLLAGLLVLAACAEGEAGGADPSWETAYTHIDGLYLDTNYRDPTGEELRMVYLFYTVYTPDQDLAVSSRATGLTVGDASYDSQVLPHQCDWMSSYYYSTYLESVTPGDPLAVVETFLLPAEAVAAGQTIALTNDQIPDMDLLVLSTDDLIHCQGAEEVARTADPTGYLNRLALQQAADPDTTAQVQAAVNGYAWSCYVNAASYQVAFSAPDAFSLTMEGERYTGQYTVEQGFLTCPVPEAGTTIAIPYRWEEDGTIDLDLLAAFS